MPAQAYASASHGEYDARSGLLRTNDRTAVVVADTRPRVRGVAVPSGLRRAAAHQINAGINVRHVLHLAAQHTRARRAASWLRGAAVQAERRLLGYAMKLTQRRICDKTKKRSDAPTVAALGTASRWAEGSAQARLRTPALHLRVARESGDGAEAACDGTAVHPTVHMIERCGQSNKELRASAFGQSVCIRNGVGRRPLRMIDIMPGRTGSKLTAVCSVAQRAGSASHRVRDAAQMHRSRNTSVVIKAGHTHS